MSKKAYVGNRANILCKQYSYFNSEEDLYEYFTKDDDSPYYFTYDGWIFQPNNCGISDSEATTILTAINDCEISFQWDIASEENYDFFSITLNDITIVEASGLDQGRWEGHLDTGDTIIMRYSKDSSNDYSNDMGYITDFAVITYDYEYVNNIPCNIKNIYIGIADVARKVKKAYIGINGTAKQWWWVDAILQYHSQVNTYSQLTYRQAATSIDNYAFFGGGCTGNVSSTKAYTSVYAYDRSLTCHSAPDLIYKSSELAAVSGHGYALFAGGIYYNKSYYRHSTVHAYDNSLTQYIPDGLSSSNSSISATTTNSYMIFAGGDVSMYTVDAYDSSLTRHSVDSLLYGRQHSLAASIGNYALFAGGYVSNSEYLNNVETYNDSLTHSTAPDLSKPTYFGSAISSFNGYALFASGDTINGDANAYVDGYNSALTKITLDNLNKRRYGHCATKVGVYAIFAGGDNQYVTNSGIAVDIYDNFLTHTTASNLKNVRYWGAATSIGNYALISGGATGRNNWNGSTTTEIYECI